MLMEGVFLIGFATNYMEFFPALILTIFANDLF